jgi:hypothetical protein
MLLYLGFKRVFSTGLQIVRETLVRMMSSYMMTRFVKYYYAQLFHPIDFLAS